MSIPPILGPINAGQSFLITSIQNNLPYVLNGAGVTGGVIYYWESNLTTALQGNFLPIFKAPNSLDDLLITDSTNGGGLAFTANQVTLGNASQPAQVDMKQERAADWPFPAIFLSAVTYTVTNSQGATATVLISPNERAATVPANNLIILPIVWYANCTSNGQYNLVNTPAHSLTNWFCLVQPTSCQASVLTKGWTVLTECQTGKFYDYCPPQQVCGQQNCNGPCASTNDLCIYQTSHYQCQKVQSNWWSSAYFIGLMIGLIILVIVLIVIIVAVKKHEATKKNELIIKNQKQ